MGKTSKWIKNLLIGKKAKGKGGDDDASFSTEIPPTPIVVPPNTPKEKKRWSFRKSSAGGKDNNPMDSISIAPRSMHPMLVYQNGEKQAVAVATTAPTDASVTAALDFSTAMRLAAAANRRSSALEEVSATMIQSIFRSYLARKALRALKGLVKLQALVRGHLVRKQAVTTLRCMQALVNAQARTRAQRIIQMAEEAQLRTQRGSNHRSFPHENRFRQTHNMDQQMEDNVKVVEMDLGESKSSRRRRNSYSANNQVERADQQYLAHYQPHLKHDYHHQMSPAPSVLTDMSLKISSGHFDEYSQCTELSDPHCYSTVSKQNPARVACSSPQPCENYASHDNNFFPNYMANTESFKAKARSQSAPKQRLDLLERQPSKKKRQWKEGTFTAVYECSGHLPMLARLLKGTSFHGQSSLTGQQFPKRIVNVIQPVQPSQTPTTADLWLHMRLEITNMIN